MNTSKQHKKRKQERKKRSKRKREEKKDSRVLSYSSTCNKVTKNT